MMFSRACACAQHINIYRNIRKSIYNKTRTIGPLLVGLRKYYIQHWGSSKTELIEIFFKKQRKYGDKSKAFWTKVWTK